jgi:four helix bundle protein
LELSLNYKSFEELPCWQKARNLCRAVSQIIGEAGFRRDSTLRDQIWRSAGSIMDNIAEGSDDGSGRECVRFLGYPQRSCGEVQSQLYRALDNKYISEAQFNIAYGLASECRKQIKGFTKYLRNLRDLGIKELRD